VISIPHRQFRELVATPSAVARAAPEHFAGPQKESFMSDPQRRDFWPPQEPFRWPHWRRPCLPPVAIRVS
jgi:hypothetical protein